jgi:hypothetical protein
MRRLAAVCLIVLLTACASVPLQVPRVDHHVLFIGNSLTYYNDLPHIVQAMYATERPSYAIEIEMLARGGAKVADHLREGRMAALLKGRHYDIVVLQDLGGFPACGKGFPGCTDAVASVCEATHLVRNAGSRPILFGTWQAIPQANSALSLATREEAQRCGLELADVGAAMQHFTRIEPAVSPWLKDGHPELVGSWIAGAVLTRAIVGRDLSADRLIKPFCRQHWQGAKFDLAKLASQQASLGSDCEMPSQNITRAAIRAANAGVD